MLHIGSTPPYRESYIFTNYQLDYPVWLCRLETGECSGGEKAASRYEWQTDAQGLCGFALFTSKQEAKAAT